MTHGLQNRRNCTMKITKMLTLNCLAAAALLGTSLSHSVVAGMPHGDQPNPNAAENALTQDSLEAKPRSEKVSKEIDVAEIKVKVSATSKSRQFVRRLSSRLQRLSEKQTKAFFGEYRATSKLRTVKERHRSIRRILAKYAGLRADERVEIELYFIEFGSSIDSIVIVKT